jgi:hypothetical protein
MGFLDGGGAALMASVFGGIYLDATLHRPTTTDNGKGGGSVNPDDVGTPVKVQMESATEAMRQAEGYTVRDVRFLMLALGVDHPDTDCQITFNGVRHAIVGPVGRDPAGAYWDIHGRPANAPNVS